MIGITLDAGGTIHWSTIAAIVDADTVTVNDAVPSLAKAGNAYILCDGKQWLIYHKSY